MKRWRRLTFELRWPDEGPADRGVRQQAPRHEQRSSDQHRRMESAGEARRVGEVTISDPREDRENGDGDQPCGPGDVAVDR